MAQLLYKTRQGSSPKGNIKVYFACHPKDHDRYFSKVTDEILECMGCAIFYYAPGEVELDEDYYLSLSQMRLIIIPVTTRLLDSPSRAMDVELTYALEHHIPVLPLLQEPGLEGRYREKFGDLQFLDKYQKDPTAIPYAEKLHKYLEEILIGHVLGIDDVFTAQIFLSYRKKDRKYAKELIHRIHRNPRCRDIAIWYDEFLNPGEDFNDSIRAELQRSDLFLLLETPNLLQEKNYILEDEYPAAKRYGIPMLLARMVPVEAAALHRALEPEGRPIPDGVDPYDDEALIQAILTKIGDRRKQPIGDHTDRIYLLGCAYRQGYRTEQNSSLAAEMFLKAAKAGHAESMHQLAILYESGDGVARDQSEAILWWGRYAEHAQHLLEKTGNHHWASEYYIRLIHLVSAWEKGEQWAGAEEVYHRMIQVIREDYPKAGIQETASELVFCYCGLGTVSRKQGNLPQAKEWYILCLPLLKQMPKEETESSRRLLATSFALMGDELQQSGHTADARECFTNALAFLEDLTDERDDPIRMMAYGGLGEIDSDARMLRRSIGLGFKLTGKRIMNYLRTCFRRKK